MRQMFRYTVPVDDQPHTFALTSGPLAVAGDNYAVHFWAEHSDDHEEAKRTFQVFGTGRALPAGAAWTGTCSRTAAGLVWHLYELDNR